jgi:hypothetical protein
MMKAQKCFGTQKEIIMSLGDQSETAPKQRINLSWIRSTWYILKNR